MRCALTIIYEGKHHLEHKDFALKMATMFDHWIVIEGHALPYGSTKRCNKLSVSATSQDGTIEFMQEFSKQHKNVHFYSRGTYWNGKDEQVNVGIEILKKITKQCYLWEVDADEHWKLEDIEQAEKIADKSKHFGFRFRFNHFLGDGLIARGEWGSNHLNRLWKWSGQKFRSHEPAMLVGQRYTEPIEEVKFDHYSYYFDKDVKFKSLYYSGHQNVYKNIEAVRNASHYPIHISALFGKDTETGRTNSYIDKIN